MNFFSAKISLSQVRDGVFSVGRRTSSSSSRNRFDEAQFRAKIFWRNFSGNFFRTKSFKTIFLIKEPIR
jgi:hypothetical protein